MAKRILFTCPVCLKPRTSSHDGILDPHLFMTRIYHDQDGGGTPTLLPCMGSGQKGTPTTPAHGGEE